MHIEHHSPRKKPPSSAGGLLRFFFFLIALALAGLTATVSVVALRGGLALADFGPPAADLNPLERAALSVYLLANRTALNTPAGTDAAPVQFAVTAGQNANTVSARLADSGLVRNPDLLSRYMRYKGLDNQIEAGNFTLNAAMTIPEIAQTLIKAAPQEVIVRVWEGWRIEQVAESLAAQPNLAITTDGFMALAGPGGQRPGGYSFLADMPAGASLEGYLFPDTYRFLPGTSAAAVVARFLSEFDSQVTTQMRSDAAAQGLTLYQAVTLASIIEREAVHDEERPVISSVFHNRLRLGMNLDADPTTQYGLAQPGDWWPQLNLDPRTVDDSYNTYAHSGLPPGPIANPGLSSLRAAIYPAATDYLYFRAKCDGSQTHNFSVTYEQHVANACP